MAILQQKRGTTAKRLAYTPANGELIYDTQLNKIFIGDGTTAGGVSILADVNIPVFSASGPGLVPARVGTVATKYLREDGTWVTPTNTTYSAMTIAEAQTGTATTGRLMTASALKQAIAYHVTVPESITGNAATATKLVNARKINGVLFDGSSDITVADSTKLSLSGGTLTGKLTIDTSTSTAEDNLFLVKAAPGRQARVKVENDLRGGFLQISGGGRYGLYDTTNAKWLIFSEPDGEGGSCSVNAASATKLKTARTIALSGAVTGTATGFDGSGNITIPVTAIDGSKITTGTIPAARIPTLNQSTTGTAAYAHAVSYESLSAGIDLNTVKTPGFYYAPADAINSYESVLGWMEVRASGNWLLQEVHTVRTSASKKYFRIFTGSSWSDWQIVYTSNNQQTDISGNAATATKLKTARTIAGVSFDGSANINLPGVNTAGNQNTTGNAGTATKLATARTIALSGGVTGSATNFDGTADISIPVTAIDGSKITTGTIPAARIPTLNQSTTGNAATATKLATARTINGVLFNGTADITIPAMGNGQAWSIVTASRAVNTTYTNSTGKPIIVNISWNYEGGSDNWGYLKVDGYSVGRGRGDPDEGISVVIPNGSTYRYEALGWGFSMWREYR